MCDIVKNPFFSGLNQNLRPLFDSNVGIVTFTKWCHLILTAKTVKNGCLGVFGPKNALNLPCFWHNFPHFTRFHTCGTDFYCIFSNHLILLSTRDVARNATT